MDTESSHLPWDDLSHAEGSIPWPALQAFAEAVTTDREVTERLFRVYDEAHEKALRETCYADLYVPAILAMAAPKLGDEQRREVGAFLLEKLAAAGQDDDDIGLEVLTAAAGAMGPVLLPLVLDALAKESDTMGAWRFLWSLTMLAVETDDPALRDPVIQACVDLLERVDRGEANRWDGGRAAWTLASLKCVKHTDLLKHLSEDATDRFLGGEYQEALALIQGNLRRKPWKELWEYPVEEWLRSRWKTARDWYAKRQTEDDMEYDGEEEAAENARLQRVEDLTAAFMKSPVGQALPLELLEEAGFIVDCLLSYGVTHLGIEVEELNESELCELLLYILPRKITADQDLFEKIAPTTEAFLQWAGSEGLLAQADVLAAKVHGWADAIVGNGMDPAYWGPGKAFAMRAEKAGIDLTDRGMVEQYLAQETLRFLEEKGLDGPAPVDYAPAIPIVEHAPKTGRNDPCPCGSGKKYKKCCGNPANPQQANV